MIESSRYVLVGLLLAGACGGPRKPPAGYTPYDEVAPEPSSALSSPTLGPSAVASAPVSPSASAAVPDACQVPVAPGACEDSIIRWAFDAQRALCRRFTYTGCNGNANNFRTLEECETTCPVGGNACSLPVETGDCKGAETRWAFDRSRHACVEFTYTGCGGNENNFMTHDECEVACHN